VKKKINTHKIDEKMEKKYETIGIKMQIDEK